MAEIVVVWSKMEGDVLGVFALMGWTPSHVMAAVASIELSYHAW